MLIAIEYVVDETVYDGGFADCLVAQKDDFVLEQWGNAAF